jgi:hypothetical protein
MTLIDSEVAFFNRFVVFATPGVLFVADVPRRGPSFL